MLMNKARAMIPPISNTQKLLIIVEIMFIVLRLSLFLMQVIESINPVKTETIFIPAHTERTPSVNVIWNKTGIKVISGKMLIINAAILNF